MMLNFLLGFMCGGFVGMLTMAVIAHGATADERFNEDQLTESEKEISK